MLVGVFGGTFDPPHLGHLGVARNVLDSGLVDEVWLIPCRIHRFTKQPARFEDRIVMCRLLVSGEERMSVSDIESELKKPGHTLDLIKALRTAHPGTSFRLVAGSDIYHEKDVWHHYDEIVKMAPPIYVERQGVDPIPEPTLAAPPDVRSSDLRAALLRRERPVDEIPQRLLDYIDDHGLYRESPCVIK